MEGVDLVSDLGTDLTPLFLYCFVVKINQALGENGFPVPEAVDWNRHCVLMSLVPGYPL